MLVASDNPRFALPNDVGPGQSVTVPVVLTAPNATGDYVVSFDLVGAPDPGWFSLNGSPSLDLPLHLQDLHSFPTRRSSDLPATLAARGSGRGTVTVTNAGSATWAAG